MRQVAKDTILKPFLGNSWGVLHAGVGILLFLGVDAGWQLFLAIVLAFFSHWPLDDLNIGEIARIYHILRGNACLTYIFTVGAWIPIVWWLVAVEPLAIPCVVAAGLLDILDWWLLPMFKIRPRGYLHLSMWPKWLHTAWGILPQVVLISMLLILVLL